MAPLRLAGQVGVSGFGGVRRGTRRRRRRPACARRCRRRGTTYQQDLAAEEQAWGLLAKAFDDVVQEATRAFGLLDVAADVFQRSVNDIVDKPVLAAAGFFNDGVLPAIAERYRPKLTATATKLVKDWLAAPELFGKIPPLFPGFEGQLADLQAKTAVALKSMDTLEQYGKEAVDARARLAGIALTGVGVGWGTSCMVSRPARRSFRVRVARTVSPACSVKGVRRSRTPSTAPVAGSRVLVMWVAASVLG